MNAVCYDEIRIVIFTVMGSRFGMDMEQISEMRQPGHVKSREYDLSWFHEKLPLREVNPVYRSPIIFFLNHGDKNTGIIVEQPEDINVPVSLNEIHPLPPLIQSSAPFLPVWGVFARNRDLILLIDFQKLLRQEADGNSTPQKTA
jgi:chemotaxis signal transduction protein